MKDSTLIFGIIIVAILIFGMKQADTQVVPVQYPWYHPYHYYHHDHHEPYHYPHY